MLMDFMDNVICRRKVLKDKGGGGNVTPQNPGVR